MASVNSPRVACHPMPPYHGPLTVPLATMQDNCVAAVNSQMGNLPLELSLTLAAAVLTILWVWEAPRRGLLNWALLNNWALCSWALLNWALLSLPLRGHGDRAPGASRQTNRQQASWQCVEQTRQDSRVPFPFASGTLRPLAPGTAHWSR